MDLPKIHQFSSANLREAAEPEAANLREEAEPMDVDSETKQTAEPANSFTGEELNRYDTQEEQSEGEGDINTGEYYAYIVTDNAHDSDSDSSWAALSPRSAYEAEFGEEPPKDWDPNSFR